MDEVLEKRHELQFLQSAPKSFCLPRCVVVMLLAEAGRELLGSSQVSSLVADTGGCSGIIWPAVAVWFGLDR